MENKTSDKSKTFHAVEFMKEVRSELTTKFLKDKSAYLDELKKAMKDFKVRQKEAHKPLLEK